MFKFKNTALVKVRFVRLVVVKDIPWHFEENTIKMDVRQKF